MRRHSRRSFQHDLPLGLWEAEADVQALGAGHKGRVEDQRPSFLSVARTTETYDVSVQAEP